MQSSVDTKGIQGVRAATRFETAVRAQQRRYPTPVSPDEQAQNSGDRAHRAVRTGATTPVAARKASSSSVAESERALGCARTTTDEPAGS